MKHITNWIGRLRQVQEKPETVMSEQLFRIVTPGVQPLDVREALVATSPIGVLAPRPGDSGPTSAAVLRFMDVAREPADMTGQYIVSEMAAILTLATGRRVQIPVEIAVSAEAQSQNITFIGYGDAIDRRLTGPFGEPVGQKFMDLLSKIASLPEPHLSVIGNACHLHQGAVELCPHDVRSAYLLLVAGIETLSREYGSPPTDWESWEDSRSWEKFMGQIQMTPEQQAALKSRLMKDKHLRLKATFKGYAAFGIPDSFWEEPWQGWMHTTHVPEGQWGENKPLPLKHVKDMVPQDREFLSQMLGASYDLRSGLVHQGKGLDLMDTAILRKVPLIATQAVPFSILRSILVELIQVELAHHASSVELPRIIHYAPEHPLPESMVRPSPTKKSEVKSPPLNRATRRAAKRQK